MICDQSEFDIRLEWGLKGVEQLAPVSDVIVIVDILSFSTSVDIAANNRATIFPYPFKDESALKFSKSVNGILADKDRNASGKYTLSPTSLINIPPNTCLVLPSPNGSALSLLSLATGKTPTLCGCMRNAKAVAEYAMSVGRKIAVIPAGEKWEDNSLRSAVEDLIGAGSIIYYLKGSLSPESRAALSVFENCMKNLNEEIKNCSSGKELIAKGCESDIDLACELNKSRCVPGLVDGAYIDLTNKNGI